MGMRVARERNRYHPGESIMIDAFTQKPMHVTALGDAGAFLFVQVDQIEDVKRLFDAHRIPYRVSKFAISIDHKPKRTQINLTRPGEARQVQEILDAVP